MDMNMLLIFASSEGAGSSMETVYKVINFVIGVGLLVYLARPMLRSFFTERRSKIEQALATAEESKIKAVELQKDLVAKKATLQTTLSDLNDRLEEDTKQLEQTLEEEAANEAKRLVEESDRMLDRFTSDQEKELRKHVAVEVVSQVKNSYSKTNDDPYFDKALAILKGQLS